MDEVYTNEKNFKSSIKSISYSPTKKTVSFTPMTSKVFQDDFILTKEEDQAKTSSTSIDSLATKNKGNTADVFNRRRHCSMVDLSHKNSGSCSKGEDKKDIYDDLIQIIVSSLQKGDEDDGNDYDDSTGLEHCKGKSVHLVTGKLRKESKSCMNLNTILPKKEVIEAISSFTNTEVISDFYEYTNNCMEIILQMKSPPKSIGKKVNFKFDFSEKKRIAVFDLDETLVHCVGSDYKKGQHKIQVNLPLNKVVQIGINIRPHFKKALKIIMQKYHIVIYTASQQAYSDAVLNFIDPKKKYFNHRLYRHHCVNETITGQHFYIKDLGIFEGVDLKDVIIIDNSVLSFAYHLDNGIPILPYYNEEKDSELGCLAYYLLAIDSSYEDLREGNKKNINLNQILSTVKSQMEQEGNGDGDNDGDNEMNDEDNLSTTSSLMRKKSVAGIELLHRYESLKEQFVNTFREKEKKNTV